MESPTLPTLPATPQTGNGTNQPGSWIPGARIGRYTLDSRVGRGGMGEVWSAWDDLLGRRVALKRLPADIKDDPERRGRFLREARALAAVTSPHVVALYSAEHLTEDEPFAGPFLVLELVEGESLETILNRGPLGTERTLDVFRQIARGLAAVHKSGVVHRDLKPSNVVIRPDGSAVLIDFGLAIIDQLFPASTRLTQEGSTVGTPAYMAPEQVRGEPVTPAADIWSAGIILYEMLSGRLPFTGRSAFEIMASILRDRPIPIEERVSEIPASLQRLISLCLEPDPARRPGTGLSLLGNIPEEKVAVAGTSTRLLAPQALAEARAHTALGKRSVLVLALAGLVGLSLVTFAAARMMPERARGRWVELSRVEEMAREVSSLVSTPQTFVASGTGWVDGEGPVLWVRRGPDSFLRWQGPTTLSFPWPPTEGEERVITDTQGKLLAWERWPALPAREPGRLLEKVKSLAGVAPPWQELISAGPPEFSRGQRVRVFRDRLGQEFSLLSSSEDVLRFEKRGPRIESGGSNLASPHVSLGLLALTAVLAALAVSRIRQRTFDLAGAVLFGVLCSAVQMAKVILNPVTLKSGIWIPVLVESLGFGVVIAMTYVAFEPSVRAAWPGALVTWVRLVHLRRAGEALGREILVGAAATVPLGLWLLAMAVLSPGSAIGAGWQNIQTFGLAGLGIRFFINLELIQLSFFAAAAALFLAALLSRLLRMAPLSLLAGTLVPAALLLQPGTSLPVSLVTVFLFALLGTAAVYRGGLISLVTFAGISCLCLSAATLSVSSWTFWRGITGPLLAASFVAVGVWQAWPRDRPLEGRSGPASSLPTPSSYQTALLVNPAHQGEGSGRNQSPERPPDLARS